MNIKLYYCKFGAGHQKTAHYMASALRLKHQMQLIDVYDDLVPGISKPLYSSYKRLIKTPQLSSYLGYITQKKAHTPIILPVLEHQITKRLQEQELPDIAIASYSMAAYFLSRYKEKTGADFKLVTCVTDFSVHKFWINPCCDLYLVASEDTKQQLLDCGVENGKILVCSLVSPQAEVANPEEKTESERLHVLVSGGGFGMLPKDVSFYQELSNSLHAEIRVICGNNRELYSKLRAAQLPHCTVYGYIHNMYEQLAWADCYIGKPGGLSLMEAIESETPIFYLQPSLSQEKENVRFIQREEIGLALTSPHFRQQANSINLFKFKSNMKKIKRQQNSDINRHLECLNGVHTV